MRSTIAASPAILALLLAFFPGPARAGEPKKPTKMEKAKWRQALGTFQRLYRHKKAEEREKGALALAGAIIPGAHLMAAKLLVTLVTEELKRGREKEEDIHFRVIEASVAGLAKVREDKAVKWLLDQVKSDKHSWRLKYAIIEGLGAKDSPEVVMALTAGAAHADPKIRIACIDAIGKLGLKEGLPALLSALKMDEWQVQISAIIALTRIPLSGKEEKLDVVDALVDALKKVNDEGGRVKWELVTALNNITGEKAGWDVLAWEMWLARERKGKTKKGRMATMPVVPTYHGVKIWSNRVVFVVDVTGSMSDPASKTESEKKPSAPIPLPPVVTGRPEEVKKRKDAERLRELQAENDKRDVRSKMDAEKRELINAVLTLDYKTHFTIVFYAGSAKLWRPELVPATAENKIDAVKEIEKLGPFGGTDIYNALIAALGIPGLKGEGGAEPGAKAPRRPAKVTGEGRKPPIEELSAAADEIFLLTDGDPTVGEMTDTDRLCEEIRKINKTRKIRIHTIAVGVEGKGQSPVNLDFLKKLAEENGGKFVHVK